MIKKKNFSFGQTDQPFGTKSNKRLATNAKGVVVGFCETKCRIALVLIVLPWLTKPEVTLVNFNLIVLTYFNRILKYFITK